MTEPNRKSDSEDRDARASGADPSLEDLLQSQDLEKRIAEARERRAQVLAERARNNTKPRTTIVGGLPVPEGRAAPNRSPDDPRRAAVRATMLQELRDSGAGLGPVSSQDADTAQDNDRPAELPDDDDFGTPGTVTEPPGQEDWGSQGQSAPTSEPIDEFAYPDVPVEQPPSPPQLTAPEPPQLASVTTYPVPGYRRSRHIRRRKTSGLASLFAAVAVSSVVVMLGASRLEIATRQSEAPAEDTAASTPPVDEADGSIDAVSVLTIPEADPVQDPVQTIPDDIVPELRESLPPGIPPVPRPARGPAPEGSAQMDGAPPRPGADIPAARSTGDAPAADLNVTPSQEIDRAIEEAETAALAPPAGREQRATDLTDPNIASRLASIPDLDRYRVRLVSGDQEVFSQLEETLMGYGVGDVERRSTSIAPRKNVVRYFREEDAEFAALLAGLLEAEPQNLETFRPRPASGEIEIWLAGS